MRCIDRKKYIFEVWGEVKAAIWSGAHTIADRIGITKGEWRQTITAECVALIVLVLVVDLATAGNGAPPELKKGASGYRYAITPLLAYKFSDNGLAVTGNGSGVWDISTGKVIASGFGHGWSVGINNNGDVVGWDFRTPPCGYSYNIYSRALLLLCHSDITEANSINNKGQIVGTFYKSSEFVHHGFIYANGSYETIDHPNMGDFNGYTEPWDINDDGVVAGSYQTGDQHSHGFYYRNGTFTAVDYPGAASTYIHGINNKLQMVGLYYAKNYYGFLYDGKTGSFAAFTPPFCPAGVAQYLIDINNKGQISGYCGSTCFIATPELPALTATPKNNGRPACPNASAGNPINVASGNKFQDEMDFTAAPHTGLELHRYYNSRDTTTSPFGANWRGSYCAKLSLASDGKIATLTRVDGRVETFKLTAGAWTSDPDVVSKLSAVMNASVQTGWKLVTAEDSTEIYFLDGRLSSITTHSGLTTTLSYDSDKNLAKATGPFGHVIAFSYDPSNRVTEAKAPDGGAYKYRYDSNNNLVSVTYPDNTMRQYLYENSGFPHALTGIVDEKGVRFATYGYDANGLATSTEHATGLEKVTIDYNPDGSSIVTDARGNSHTISFTTQYDTVKPSNMNNSACSTCGAGVSYSYDANGFVARLTDFNGNVTTYQRNARGLETSRTEAHGTPEARTIATTWHDMWRLPLRVVEPERTTDFTYDGHGNLLRKTIAAKGQSRSWSYTYNAKGQILTIDGPRTDVKDVTKFCYDGKTGYLQSVTNALGHITSLSKYDNAGRLLSLKLANGLTIALVYDLRGRLTKLTAGAKVTAYAYDRAGNLTRITNPDGSYLAYTYDDAHRLNKVSDALGNYITYVLDGNSNITTAKVYETKAGLVKTFFMAYDALNRLSGITGAMNQTTALERDGNGNITSVTDPLKHETVSSFDPLDRLIQMTDPNGGVIHYTYSPSDRLVDVSDPRKLITSYVYDGLGNNTSTQNPDTGIANKTYDAAGNLTSSVDARGKTTKYTYDALNRITKATFADGKTITYAYDTGTNGRGRLVSMTDSSGRTTWTYDMHGRVLVKQQRVGNVTLRDTATYDKAGRLATFTYPSGKKLSYVYESKSGQLAGININSQTVINNIAYRPFGPVSSWIMGNNAQHTRTFDTDGRVTRIALIGKTSDSIAVTYDAASRITGISSPDPAKGFVYDPLDRLVSYSKASAVNQTYTYDANGNRLSLNASGSITGYVIDAASNRLIKQTGTTPLVFSYDATGNMTGDGAKYGPRSFVYDASGRMVQASTGSKVALYAINGLGQRVKKTSSGIATGAALFMYDEAGNLIGEYSATGAVVNETVWLPSSPTSNALPVGVLTGTSRTAVIYYVQPDHLGAPRIILDTKSASVWKWDRDPFGTSQPTGTLTYNLRFPGQYYDGETGLHYNMARDYNPAHGRYVQSDPIGLAGGINTYGYAGQNPVSLTDHDGTFVPVPIVVGAVIGAATGYYFNGWRGAAVGLVTGATFGWLTPIATNGLGVIAGTAIGAGLNAIGDASGTFLTNWWMGKPLLDNVGMSALLGSTAALATLDPLIGALFGEGLWTPIMSLNTGVLDFSLAVIDDGFSKKRDICSKK